MRLTSSFARHSVTFWYAKRLLSRVTQKSKNKERDIIAKRENSKLTAVLFSYVGTSEEFNQFLRAMLKNYLTDGEVCLEKSFEDDET